jgi:hypothetical protein
MAKTKYDPDTFPILAKGYARQGLTDAGIMKRLGVGHDAFYRYVKTYPEFASALKEAKALIDIAVEDSLLRRALGYSVTETSTTKKGGKVLETKTIEKEVVPDVTAQIFWLKNRKPEIWREKQIIKMDYEKLTDEDLAKVSESILEKHLGENGPQKKNP